MRDYRELIGNGINGLTQGAKDPNGITDEVLTEYDYYNKVGCVESNNSLDINRMLNFAKYKGLPDTLPGEEIEKIILPGGFGVITKVRDSLVAYKCTLAPSDKAPIDCYHRPIKARVIEPFGNVIPGLPIPDKLDFTKDLEIGKDCVLIKNDPNGYGILPIITKYNVYQQEVEIAMLNSTIYNSFTKLLVGKDDRILTLINNMLNDVRKGAPATIVGKQIADIIPDVDLKDFGGLNNGILTNYRDIIQYLMSMKYNILGFDSNFNMKNEDLTANETELNENLIDNNPKLWMATRKKFIEQYNEMYAEEFGEASVEYGESFDHLNPHPVMMPEMTEEDSENFNNDETQEEISEPENPVDQPQEMPVESPETIEQPIEQGEEEKPVEEANNPSDDVVEVVEDIKEIVETIVEEKEDDADDDDRTDNAESTD